MSSDTEREKPLPSAFCGLPLPLQKLMVELEQSLSRCSKHLSDSLRSPSATRKAWLKMTYFGESVPSCDEEDQVAIRPELQKLINRGNITPEEVKTIRANSEEWEELYLAMGDVALLETVTHNLHNCARVDVHCYEKALHEILVPELLKRLARAALPIHMRLECPCCGELHIDEGEFVTKLHHTHACQHCGNVWRPALVPTLGVRFLPGFKNT